MTETAEQSVKRWGRQEREMTRKLLDLHEKFDKSLTHGGFTTDLVQDLHLTKGEVASLMALIEQSL